MITSEQATRMIGAKVYDSEGEKVGTVGQVYVDERDGHPAWIAVRTGWFGINESFVPLDRQTRFEGEELHVSAHKDVIKSAPQVEPDGGDLSERSVQELHGYYNMPSERGVAGMDQTQRQRTLAANAGRNMNLTRYEEQLRVGKEQVESGHVRLRKHVVTEDVTTTVPVRREEVRVERETIDSTRATGDRRHEFADDSAEVTLHAERPVVSKETVPVERVGLVKETHTEQEPVKGTVRKEKIEVEDDRRRRDR